MKYIVLIGDSEIEFVDQTTAQDHASLLVEKCTIISDQERSERILAKLKREYGIYISNNCVELLGAKNKILNLTGTQVASMLQALTPIKLLLETGALGTARGYLIQLKAVYPNHADIFQDGIDSINSFEAEYGL